MNDKWKKLLSAVAPTIATALGGPLAGTAVAALAKAIGKPDANEEEIAAIVSSADPETLLKLKTAEQEFAAKMKELDIEWERVNAGDRASARQREIAVRDNVPKILATAVTAGFFGVLFWILKYGLPATGGEALLVLLGALGSGFGAVLNYYFGSSHGSAQKNTMLDRMAKATP